MNKFLLLLAAPLLLFAACDSNSTSVTTPSTANSVYNTPLLVGQKNILVQIVKNQNDMQEGLSGRPGLTNDQGMLFDFGSLQNPSFWMKDMKFNLDFVWIANGKIIYITKNVSAPPAGTSDGQLKLYNSPSPVDWVLEVSAGWADGNKIKIGDEVRLGN